MERLRVVRRPMRYAIVVRGELDTRFAYAFDEMTVHAESGRTHIVGEVIDQSHLIGLLERIAGLGIALISVNPISGWRQHMTLGPVELLVVKFPGNQFKGEIAPALTALVESGTIRIIDLLFANKDADGRVEMVEVNDLDDADFRKFDPIVTDVTDLLTAEDVDALTQALEPNSSAALLLFEDTWATRFRDTLLNANAELVLYEHLPKAVINQLIGNTESTTAAPTT